MLSVRGFMIAACFKSLCKQVFSGQYYCLAESSFIAYNMPPRKRKAVSLIHYLVCFFIFIYNVIKA